MNKENGLYLYEEVMLLALHDDKGTLGTSFSDYAVSGAVLAELAMSGRIEVEETKKQLVNVLDAAPTGDPVIDECIEKMATSKRRASLASWVSKLAGIKKLRHKVATQLVKRGILKADERKILWLFTQKIYPELNPEPEDEIVARLQTAIFDDVPEIDEHTCVLISLADGSNLLDATFGRKEMKGRKERVAQIINGELVGKATKETITAVQTAVFVAAIMPAFIAATTAST